MPGGRRTVDGATSAADPLLETPSRQTVAGDTARAVSIQDAADRTRPDDHRGLPERRVGPSAVPSPARADHRVGHTMGRRDRWAWTGGRVHPAVVSAGRPIRGPDRGPH